MLAVPTRFITGKKKNDTFMKTEENGKIES